MSSSMLSDSFLAKASNFASSLASKLSPTPSAGSGRGGSAAYFRLPNAPSSRLSSFSRRRGP